MMKLVVVEGEMAGVEFPLTVPVTTLGRRSDNDVCLPLDMRISRSHARITVRDGQYLLEDVGSANGVFVGQRRIHQPTPLQPGDKFRLGRTWLMLVQQQPPEESAARQVVLVEPEAEAQGGAAAEAASIVYALDAAAPGAEPTDAEEARRRLAVMLDFSTALAAVRELPELLQVAVTRIMEVLPAEQVSLLLRDDTTGEIVPRVLRSREGEVAPAQLRISRNIVSQAMEQRVAILTSDATADARFLEADSVQDLRIRSAICAPMITPRGPVGVIYLDTSSRTHVFGEQDVRLVAGIAAVTGIAIEDARLYTDLRTAYEELKAAQEQLVRSERIATVGMLAASIAHDMANIVSPLRPLIEMALEGREMDQRAQDVLRHQSGRLITMVQRLLAFSRSRELKLEETDINSVVDETLELVRTELAHRKVKVNVAATECPLVRADRAQLERALLNLIINAADALESCTVREIEIRTGVEENEVLVSVKDTGPGIPLETQQRLFEPFFTTKPTGTGLGLFTCRRIVEEEHGGTLELDSREGEGTTITIRLPALQAAAA